MTEQQWLDLFDGGRRPVQESLLPPPVDPYQDTLLDPEYGNESTCKWLLQRGYTIITLLTYTVVAVTVVLLASLIIKSALASASQLCGHHPRTTKFTGAITVYLIVVRNIDLPALLGTAVLGDLREEGRFLPMLLANVYSVLYLSIPACLFMWYLRLGPWTMEQAEAECPPNRQAQDDLTGHPYASILALPAVKFGEEAREAWRPAERDRFPYERVSDC